MTIEIVGIIAHYACIKCQRPMDCNPGWTHREVPTDGGPAKLDGVAIPSIVYVCPDCSRDSRKP